MPRVVHQVPASGLQLLDCAGARRANLAITAAIRALAVHTHARSDDQFRYGPANERLEQDGSTSIVDVDVLLDFIHALADTNRRSEVKYRVHPGQRALDVTPLADVTAKRFNRCIQVRW